MQRQLENFLITYRNTPHSITQEPPSKLFLGRQLRTRLDMLIPSPADHPEERPVIAPRNKDRKRKTRSFHLGNRVMTRDFRHPTADWKPGSIEQKTGPVSYVVRLDTGLLWRRHVDHIRRYGNNTIVPSDDITFELKPPANEDQNNTRSHQPNRIKHGCVIKRSNLSLSSSQSQTCGSLHVLEPMCNKCYFGEGECSVV